MVTDQLAAPGYDGSICEIGTGSASPMEEREEENDEDDDDESLNKDAYFHISTINVPFTCT
jgi:hypothetical protein